MSDMPAPIAVVRHVLKAVPRELVPAAVLGVGGGASFEITARTALGDAVLDWIGIAAVSASLLLICAHSAWALWTKAIGKRRAPDEAPRSRRRRSGGSTGAGQGGTSDPQ
jgi:hypothetical protein